MAERRAFLVFSGANDRAVLAFLRALSLCGHRARIVACTRFDRILRTRYHRDVLVVRDTPELTLEVFQSCLQKVRAVAGDIELVVLPSSEYFNHFLLAHREKIERMGCVIPLVRAATYNLLTNKQSAMELFSAAGLAVPAAYPAPDDSRLPLVAKPIRNLNDRGVSLYPVLLRTKQDVRDFSSANAIEDFFFQEFVEGNSLYLFVHVTQHPEHVLVWSQRNILQQPHGKSMLVAEAHDLHSTPVAKQLVDVLMDAEFTGLGMVELIDDGKRLVFIEMNPRIWGPIQFCLDQGQPLLQAFIGQCLDRDAARYLTLRTRRQRSHYFWLGGLLETISGRARPDFHADRIPWFRLALLCARNDIYLRMDSWRCFLFEAWLSMIKAFHGKRYHA